MKIKLTITVCMALLYVSSHAMQQNFYDQPENNNQQEIVTLFQALNRIDQGLRNRGIDHLQGYITPARDMVQQFRRQLQPELRRRRQHAGEFHTVAPMIDTILEQIDKKFDAMGPIVSALRQYRAKIDGKENVPLLQLTGLTSDIKLALAKLFRIINQQQFPRKQQTLAQCLQQASLTQQYELGRTAWECYQRWFINGEQAPVNQAPAQANPAPQPAAPQANPAPQPAANAQAAQNAVPQVAAPQANQAPAQANPAPQPAANAQIPGHENIERLRNFLTDLHMQWLIKLENVDLLINHLDDYLNHPNVQGDLPAIIGVGNQVAGQLALMGENAEHIVTVQNAILGGAHAWNRIAGGFGAASNFVHNWVFGGAHAADQNDADDPVQAAGPDAAQPQPAAMDADGWRQLFRNLNRIVEQYLINIPRNIQAGLGNPFTRDQRLGSPDFGALLQREAQTWNDAAQQAHAAQPANAEHH